MEQKKTRSYLLYALGEVFLVVIGILIALQVNNWNEGRIQKTKEVSLLSEIRHALIEDQKDLNSVMRTERRKITSAIILADIHSNKQPFHDSLKVHFQNLFIARGSFTPRTSPYETLKTYGSELISNDSLRIMVASLYDFEYLNYENLKSDYKRKRGDWSNMISTHYRFTYLLATPRQLEESLNNPDRVYFNDEIIPNSWEQFLSDSNQGSFINYHIGDALIGVFYPEFLIKEIDMVVAMIDAEINNQH